MNKGLLALNVVLLLAVGVLFFLHFNKGGKGTGANRGSFNDSTNKHKPFRIAYFDMDSVESSFVLAKEIQAELSKKDDNINAEMSRMQANYQRQFQKYQEMGSTMTPVQVEAAQKDLFQLEQNIKSRKAQLDQEYQSFYMSKQQEILSLIRKFCEDYNDDGRFSLIISNEPGLIYYKDTTFNITKDLLKGLNDMYAKQKSNK